MPPICSSIAEGDSCSQSGASPSHCIRSSRPNRVSSPVSAQGQNLWIERIRKLADLELVSSLDHNFEALEHANELLEILCGGGRNHVHVLGRSHVAVETDGHAADHQEVDPLPGELGEMPWISSSAKALATAGCRYSGHELRELEDLFHSLSGSEFLIFPPQCGTIGPTVGRPVAFARGLHGPKVPAAHREKRHLAAVSGQGASR